MAYNTCNIIKYLKISKVTGGFHTNVATVIKFQAIKETV